MRVATFTADCMLNDDGGRLMSVQGRVRGSRSVVAGFAAVVGLAALVAVGGPESASAAPAAVVYDSIPGTLAGNYPSQAFEATSTSEFGDKVGIAGGAGLKTVRVLMSSWGCESGSWVPAGSCVTTSGATFSHPITLNVYAVNGSGGPGALLATKTQTFAIPYRPSADGINCPVNPEKWYSVADATCYNGYATSITFDLSTTTVGMPDEIIWSVAYNTTHYGYAPVGEAAACYTEAGGCGYDSLNVAATGPTTVGVDIDPDGALLNSSWAGAYCDAGAGGTGTFRIDTSAGCWAGFVPMAEIELRATTDIVVTPNAMNGWFFLNEGVNGTGYLVNGPDVPPLGRGSALLSIDGTGRENIETFAFAGTLLDTITNLRYSTYRAFPTSGSEAPTLQFDVDYDSTDASTAFQGRLVFDPSAAGTVSGGTWQNWDTQIGPASGTWWSSGTPIVANVASAQACTTANYCTWPEILSNYPDARIRPTSGQLLVRVGGPVAGGFSGATDKVIVGVNGNDKVIDFEPGDGTIVVNPTTAPKIGFSFVTETPTGAGSFVAGPINALGQGSAQLSVNAGGTSIASGVFESVRLDRFTTQSYRTYRQPGSSVNAPTLQFDADYDSTDSSTAFQGRIVFEPKLTGATITQSAWQTWNPLTATTGWWMTGTPIVGGSPVAQACTSGSPCSWTALLSAYPDARVRPVTGQFAGTPIAGGVWLKAGSGWGSFTGSVDALTVGVDGANVIYNFEGAAPIAITVSDVNQSEGDSGARTMKFVVALNRPATSTVMVNYTTLNGTAVAPGDYTSTSGTFTFTTGQISKTLDVTLVTDTTFEPNETMFVQLSGASGGFITDGLGRGTLFDFDGIAGQRLTAGKAATSHEGDAGNRIMIVPVSLEQPAAAAITVAWSTGGGSALAGTDYISASGSVTFNAGERVKYVQITIKPDLVSDHGETFNINLGAISGAGAGSIVGPNVLSSNQFINDSADFGSDSTLGDP